MKQKIMGWQWHQLNHNANHLHLIQTYLILIIAVLLSAPVCLSVVKWKKADPSIHSKKAQPIKQNTLYVKTWPNNIL